MRARIAACTTASAAAGSSSARRPGQKPPPSSADQPGKPPASTHCSFTANSSTSSMPSQKLGTARPSCVRPITRWSPARPCWLAAHQPAPSASTTVIDIASSASGRVRARRSRIRSATGAP